jgi:methylated-DNA-[protein]-cysteine S-methyltransferase
VIVAEETSGPKTATRLRVKSPIGDLVVSGDADAITGILLPGGSRGVKTSADRGGAPGPVRDAARQLDEYFGQKRRTFDLPLALFGTEFQEQVWRTLAEIPYGETVSYAELARWVGRPGASRAVGQANGANPIPIVLPCHRVIAADGTIGGYGGGVATKRRLLALESAPG